LPVFPHFSKGITAQAAEDNSMVRNVGV